MPRLSAKRAFGQRSQTMIEISWLSPSVYEGCMLMNLCGVPLRPQANDLIGLMPVPGRRMIKFILSIGLILYYKVIVFVLLFS